MMRDPNLGHTTDGYAEMLAHRIAKTLTETRDDAGKIAFLTAERLIQFSRQELLTAFTKQSLE